ncbi:MAG: serine hydrolase, partial [Proteobacteria bacterium]|nr:serine hydrolase [Pseudomonadota bacterium]
DSADDPDAPADDTEPLVADLNPVSVAAFFDAAFPLQRLEHEMVGAVVVVVHGGQVIFKRGYGFADLDARTPVDPDQTLFRIASISKTFAWTSIMQLYEQRRLGLNDEVNSHLDFEIPPTFFEPIRISHLMAHTPGFEEMATGGSVRALAAMPTLRDHLAADQPARVRPPGRHASYSNYGASLAGHIVERVSGKQWAEYVDAQILAPLDMRSTNTHHGLSDDFAARHAKGYKFTSGKFEPTPFQYIKDMPAGGMSTTGDDMSRYMLAHLNSGEYGGARILREATAREMQTILFAPHEGVAPMLHGFYRSDRNGQVVLGHGGDINQFHSDMSLLPEAGLGIFVSYNSDPGAAARSNVIAAFIDRFFPAQYLRAAPAPRATNLADYAGEYVPLRINTSTFERLSILISNLRISAADGELLVGGQSRWVATGPDRFSARYADRNMVFERGDDGDISYVLINSPLGTFERVEGLNSPSVIRALMAFAFAVALLAVVGYGYRVMRRAPVEKRLPWGGVLFGWLYAVVLIALYAQLVMTLTGDVEEFVYGVPDATHLNLVLMNANIVLGLFVIFYAVRYWLRGAGGVFARLRYSTLALAVIVNTWIAWYFNFMAYLITMDYERELFAGLLQ